MNGNCHFVFGASVGTALAINMECISSVLPNVIPSNETAALLIMGGIVGGIFPDIDNPSSHMGRLSVPLSTVIGKISAAFGKKGYNHRGILHDPIVYLIGLVASYAFCPALIGLFMGCLSHVFLDCFNPSGVPFVFGIKRLHLGKIISGSKASVVFTWFSTCLMLAGGIAVKFALL